MTTTSAKIAFSRLKACKLWQTREAIIETLKKSNKALTIAEISHHTCINKSIKSCTIDAVSDMVYELLKFRVLTKEGKTICPITGKITSLLRLAR